ncbi:MAG: UDP-N-acetylglucosamine 2-epimerase [Firmicutes bacterium]|nr:UDP-N-acetylglucosamine 2-epimerase [Bacillota bacterium]
MQKCFNSKGINRVKIVDLFREAHPLINAIVRYAYLKSFYFAPSIYGWLYYSSRQMGPGTVFSKLINSFGSKKLEEIIIAEQPDAIINTFPFPAIANLRQKTGIAIPAFTVITDFTLHQRWVQPEIDRYYVATGDLRNELVRSGIPPKRIKVSGIPLRDSFTELKEITGLHQKYGLNPAQKTVLVMSGAYGGLHKIKQICQNLLLIPGLEVAVVCGKDKTMERKLKNSFCNCKSVHVFGFVEDIHELMKISCCIVTKAGGITLSEAAATRLPIVIFRPVPGQERDNAIYFAKKKAAVVINEAGKIPDQISSILLNDHGLSRMRPAVRSLQKHRATETVVADILHELAKKAGNRERYKKTRLSRAH